jgi:elongation factor Ts
MIMEINLELLKQLREETSISLGECKKALEESAGDLEKAKEILQKKGAAAAVKKADRETTAGIIDTYVHSNKRLGVMIQLACETDFVSRSDDFQLLAHEICLQIASMKPIYVKEEDIPTEELERLNNIFTEQAQAMGKSKEVAEGIVKGKLEKFKKENCLMSQAWVKDDSKTIKDLINEAIAKLGENILVKKFVIYEF